MAGLLGSANLGAYFASKHAVEGMAKCLRQEMAVWLIYNCIILYSVGFFYSNILIIIFQPWGISVSNVNPAFMR